MRIVPESKSQFKPGCRVGRLVVLGSGFYLPESRQASARFVCECDCGNVTVVRSASLHRKTQSCGCFREEKLAADSSSRSGINHPNYKHGNARQGAPSRLYRIWQKMRRRCCNAMDPKYPSYGGRGIGVCQEWSESFPCFSLWAMSNGYSDKLTIDRKDNDGNYEPSNCRWAGDFEQANNRRSSRFVSAFGETKTIAQWSRDSRCAVNVDALWYRIDAGFEPEIAIASQARCLKPLLG